MGRNAGLDHDIHGAARHDEVLDIVTAYEYESAPPVDIGMVDDGKARYRPRAEKGNTGRRPVDVGAHDPDRTNGNRCQGYAQQCVPDEIRQSPAAARTALP